MTPLKIDYIACGSENTPLLRIQGNDFQTARELYHAIRALRDSMGGSVNIHQLPGFVASEGLTLRFEYSDQSLGVSKHGDGNDFICQLSREGWIQVEDMLAPFCDRQFNRNGFQWLDESGDISFLFTTDGGW